MIKQINQTVKGIFLVLIFFLISFVESKCKIKLSLLKII